MKSFLLISLALTACVQAAPKDFVTIRGDQFVHQDRIIKLKGTNYYPREHMWQHLWDQWDPQAIRGEVRMIQELGLNSVRILVPYRNGGWNGPAVPETRVRMLIELVNTFGDHGIRVCVTLFDWETSFAEKGHKKEAEHLQYLAAIVPKLRDNPYVLMWDVKNEPEHPSNLKGKDAWDCCPEQKARIIDWLRRMCDEVRRLDKNHPVTVGMRWYANTPDVLDFVDVAVLHSYSPDIGDKQIPTVKAAMGQRLKPILVQEFGWPSHPNPCDRDGNLVTNFTEQVQKDLYAAHLDAFEKHNIAGAFQ